jgi:hypothetical protein
VVVGRLSGSLFLATGSRGGVADMLDKVDASSVSIAKLCKRLLPDDAILGDDGLSASTEEGNGEAVLLGVLGISSCTSLQEEAKPGK